MIMDWEIKDDVITPVYACGMRGPRVDLDHGARYAESKLVKDSERHEVNTKRRCVRCLLARNTEDAKHQHKIMAELPLLFATKES